MANTRGDAFAVGDADHAISIQSVSKPFVFALVCDALDPAEVAQRLGVDGTGLPFNSVMAFELRPDRTTNPMVNSGAIATTSLVPGATAAERWDNVRTGLSRFAGRRLELDERVYQSEAATNQRNAGIAHLLRGYGRVYCDPDDATDVYTRQCSLLVTARDLAVMGATLAGGGVNPVTGERVVSAGTCRRVLAVMATAGLYERSGEWLYDVGLPGKSGVSGGIDHRGARQGRGGSVLAALGCRGQQRARAPGHEVPVGAPGSEPVCVRSQCASRGFEPGVAMSRTVSGTGFRRAGRSVE